MLHVLIGHPHRLELQAVGFPPSVLLGWNGDGLGRTCGMVHEGQDSTPPVVWVLPGKLPGKAPTRSLRSKASPGELPRDSAHSLRLRVYAGGEHGLFAMVAAGNKPCQRETECLANTGEHTLFATFMAANKPYGEGGEHLFRGFILACIGQAVEGTYPTDTPLPPPQTPADGLWAPTAESTKLTAWNTL